MRLYRSGDSPYVVDNLRLSTTPGRGLTYGSPPAHHALAHSRRFDPFESSCISTLIDNFRFYPSYEKMVAEREGFEPSIRFYTYARLASECLQPLGHLSFSLFAACFGLRVSHPSLTYDGYEGKTNSTHVLFFYR